jgi:hypothetical protein
MSNIIYIRKPISSNPCLDSLRTGLVAGYDFNESSGNLIDFVGSNHLTVYGTLRRGEPGIFGNSYKFGENTNSYIQGAQPLAGLSEWTIIAIFKTYKIQTGNYIIHSNVGSATAPNFTLRLDHITNGYISDGINNLGHPDGVAHPINTWLGHAYRGYANGTIVYHSGVTLGANVNIGSWNGNYRYIHNTIRIGSYYMASYLSWLYQGWIDTMLFWNRQLSDCELTAFYNKGNFTDLR